MLHVEQDQGSHDCGFRNWSMGLDKRPAILAVLARDSEAAGEERRHTLDACCFATLMGVSPAHFSGCAFRTNRAPRSIGAPMQADHPPARQRTRAKKRVT